MPPHYYCSFLPPPQILRPSYGPDLMAKLPLHFAKKFSPTPFMLIEIDHKVFQYLVNLN